MDVAMMKKPLFGFLTRRREEKIHRVISDLASGKANVSYTIKEIRTVDQDMKDFLFTLGCYEGEQVTVISRLADNIVISVKDARYSINTELAKVIII